MKKITFALFLTLLSYFGYGQENVNISFNQEMGRIFTGLEKERVPHGILLDFGMEFTNVPAFNGTLTDSTYVTPIRLKRIYKTLLTSRIREVSEGFVRGGQFSEEWRQARSSEYIALSGLYFKYSRFSENGYPEKINVDGGVITDKYVNGVWQNPYQESAVFAIAPPLPVYKGLEMQVKLPRNIFHSNNGQNIQSIQIDFSDGHGFRPLEYDQLLDVRYAEEGVKIWKYKLIRNNGEILLAHSMIKIEIGLSLSTATECNGLYVVGLTADLAYLNEYGEVTVTVDRANGNCNITKPLIVAEGFDVGTLLNPENIYGQNNILNFEESVFESGSDIKPLISGNSLEDYNDQQYDIIYVDWENGVDYLQRNAYALEKVIEWVNNEKAGNEPNVVLGQSMGGVIARYALVDMENRDVDHETRLFISHDAPQQGANVPLALQFLYRNLTNQYIQASQTLFGGSVLVPLFEDAGGDAYLSLLDAPASRQLLKVWSNLNYNVDNSLHDSFYNDLQNLNTNNGYPQDPNIRNIAISNGSECGNTQTLQPYQMLVGFEYNQGLSFWGDLLSLIYNPLGGLVGGLFLDDDFFEAGFLGLIPGSSRYIVDFEAKAMGYGTNQIYKGLVRYEKEILWVLHSQKTIIDVKKNQPDGVLPFGIYGGGYFSIGSITGNIDMPNLTVADRFGFICTASGLDIGSGNASLSDYDYKNEYVGANPPSPPKVSPFDNFITAYVSNGNTNQQHISFQTRNGNWLAKELQANGQNPDYPTANCSFFCSNSTIAGPDYLCGGSAVFSTNHQTETLNWYISDGNELVTVQENGNSITISPLNNKNGQLVLNLIYGNDICGTRTLSKNIWIGKPSFHLVIDPVGNTNYVDLEIKGSGGTSMTDQHITNTTWQVTASNEGGGIQFTPNGSFSTTASGIGYNWAIDLKITATNACGTTTNEYHNIAPPAQDDPCDELLMMSSYPNPTTNSLNVVISFSPEIPCDENTNALYGNSVNNQVKIYDLQGNTQYSNNFNSSNFTIQNLNLQTGGHILKVTTANGKMAQEMIIVE